MTEGFSIALKGTYGNELSDHLMLGDYVQAGEDYYPTQTVAAWIDAESTDGPVRFGNFGGYTQQLGISEEIDLATAAVTARGYAAGANIDNIWRVAPRIVFQEGKLRLAGELEVTSAQYVPGVDNELVPERDGDAATNTRLLLAAYYFF